MIRKTKVTIPGFDQKWTKKLLAGLSEQGLSDFIADVDSVPDKDAMVALMAKSNKHMSSARRDMEDCMDLKMAKETVRDLSAPFKGVMNCQQAKIEYFLHMIAKKQWP